MPRPLEILDVPTGPGVLDLLPRLTAALHGGPALMLLPPGNSSAAIVSDARRAVAPTLDPADDDQDDPTAIVLPTSGSTGEPKLVLLPVSALRASATAAERRLGGPGGWLLTLPAGHIAGLQVLLRAAVANMPVAAMETSSFTAEGFARTAAGLDADRRYVSLVPTQLHRILADPGASAVLSGFHRVLVGGAATPPSLLSRAHAAGIPIVTTYGMSETCGGCVYDGRPLDGMAVTIHIDPAGTHGDPGRIALTGRMVARGYLGQPDHPAFAIPGTFVTEDLGLLAAGTLRVLGRADDVIITGGLKVAPSVVERALAALPRIGEVLVVGVPDPEWGERVVVVVTGAIPAGDVVDAALTGLPRHHRPWQWIEVEALPLRGPGKPDRKRAAQVAIERLS